MENLRFTIRVLPFALFLSFSSVPVISADTPVSGAISTDTVWQKSASPYLVTDTIYVAEGATLTVQPGVTVRFESGRAMLIDGSIVAVGTQSDNIIFTSTAGRPTVGLWGGIRITDTAVPSVWADDTTYVSGSTFPMLMDALRSR